MDPDARLERRIGRGATAIRTLISHSHPKLRLRFRSRAAHRLVGDWTGALQEAHKRSSSRHTADSSSSAQLRTLLLLAAGFWTTWTTRRFRA